MHTVTLDDIRQFVAENGSFKPFMRSHAELVGKLIDDADRDLVDKPRNVATMFSTKLNNRVHFRDGEVTAWAGYNGHRKSMFLGQVTADLLVQRKPVLVMSMEMQSHVTLLRMARQMAGTDKPSRAWLENFGRWSRSLWLFDYTGRIDPDLCLGACRWFANNAYAPHIVIDSMMMVVSSEEHLDPQKQFMTDLVRFTAESGAHVHLVNHCRKPGKDGDDEPPTKYELRGSAAISDQAHNVIMVWSNKPKQRALEEDPTDAKALQQPDAIVCVDKQRNGSWEGRAKLWFDDKSLRFMNDRTSPVEPYVLQESV